MSRHRAKATITEKGQVLVMAALVIIVLVAAIGLAIDLGRMMVARAQLVRAVDAAALAGTLELPNLTTAEAKVRAYMAANEPSAQVDVPISPADRQIEVNGSKTVPMFFIKVLGISSVKVTAHATAGFGVLAVDTVMAIDATGSMGSGTGCPNGATCPIVAAKNAAKSFTDTLLSGSVVSSETLVGETPYRGCFNTPNPLSGCVPLATMMQPLSNNKTAIQAKINGVASEGGTGTNVCNGMLKANEILFGAGHHTVSNALHIIVILSDGDNTYNVRSNGVDATPVGSPPRTPTPNPARQLPAACRPSNPYQSSDDTGTSCLAAQPHQKELDIKTKQMADQLKANGVEVYVVGFGVCGTSNNNLCNTGMIGSSTHDNTANRNLLKCIASSTAGTNDHYFEATSASQLPAIFTNIARLIGFRLIK
jgi:Flp pilus assembly protein TadG